MSATKKTLSNIAIGIVIGVSSLVVGNALLRALFPLAKPRLSAQVEFGPCYYPPQLQTELDALWKGLDDDRDALSQRWDEIRDDVQVSKLEEQIKNEKGLSPASRYRIAREMGDYLDSKFPTSYQFLEGLNLIRDPFHQKPTPWLRRGPISWPSWYWSAQVKNDGNQAAREVSIDLPSAVYATVKKSNQSATSADVSGRVQIGDLLPKDQVTVTAWADSAPNEYEAERIVLRCDGGAGSVSVRLLSSSVWHSVESIWNFFKWSIWFVAIGAGAWVVWLILNRMARQQVDNPGGDTRAHDPARPTDPE